MKIIKLEAENFKRLKAVKITPEGDIVNITGENGAGKSSVLDSIWAALGGAAALPKVPVRVGAEEAKITVDLGTYKVTRKFKDKGEGEFTTSLVIENPDGSRPKSPQTLLDEIVGKMTMDPEAFIRLSPKAQFDALKVLVPGLDLDDIKAKNDADYERRTAENRKAKEARSAAALVGAKDGKRIQRIDTAEMMAKLASASEVNKGIEDRKARRAAATKQVETYLDMIAKNKDEIVALQNRIAALQADINSYTKEATSLEIRLQNAEPLPPPVDTAELTRAISEANAANAEAEKQERRDAALAEAEKHEAAAKALTEAMEAREEHKRAAIAAAKFPVEGLSLGEEEVLIDGLPFDQAHTSKKIRTSMAIAMAANPEVRVIRIVNGSMLDSKSMKIVADMAREGDFQVWVERVSDGDGVGIIIEDGHAKNQ